MILLLVLELWLPQGHAAPISFDEGFKQILIRSTALQIQQTRIGFAEANAIPAKFQFAPSLVVNASKIRSENSISQISRNTAVEAVANYNLIHWGADLANLKAANLDVDTQKSTLESVRFSTEDAAVSALLAEIQDKQTIEVNQSIVETQGTLLKLARERFSKGYLATQEVDKIAVDLENAKASLADALGTEATSKTNLENLMGSSELNSVWPWMDHFQKFKQNIMAQELNLREHPEYLAARARAQAEAERSHKTKSLLLPSLDARLSYGYYGGDQSSLYLTSPTAKLLPALTTGLVLTWPIFDHLTTYAASRAQSSLSEASDIALVQKERDLKSSFDANRNNFQIALNAALSREKTLETSRKIYQDSLRRVRAGRIAANDFVIDQKRLFDSELFAIQGWANVHVLFPKLCHSLGYRLEQCLPWAEKELK